VTAIADNRPAARAAARVFRASALIGLLALTGVGLVVLRLFETWRVTPRVASHHISVVGQRLGYPVANAAAVAVVVLAALGLTVLARAISSTAHELAAARRVRRMIAGSAPRRLGDAFAIDDDRPGAFCAGLVRPRAYVTSGAIAMLDEAALDAVLVHERHHVRCRDPLRLAAYRVLSRALFFVPGLRELDRRGRALSELSADESVVNGMPGGRSALASAMLSFSDAGRPIGAAGIDPLRVDFLLGEPPSRGLPLLISLIAVLLLALLIGVALLVGRVAAGSATLAAPFLSDQPCVIVLAIVPATVMLAFRWLNRVR